MIARLRISVAPHVKHPFPIVRINPETVKANFMTGFSPKLHCPMDARSGVDHGWMDQHRWTIAKRAAHHGLRLGNGQTGPLPSTGVYLLSTYHLTVRVEYTVFVSTRREVSLGKSIRPKPQELFWSIDRYKVTTAALGCLSGDR